MSEAIDLRTDAVVTEMQPERERMGGNRPPFLEFYTEQNNALPGHLAAEYASLVSDVETLKADFDLSPEKVDSDDIEKQLTELGSRLSKFIKLSEAQRKITKDPTIKAGQIVDNFFNGMRDKVALSLSQVERRVNAWKDEKRRIERERQAAEEARAREAAAEAARLKAEAERAERERVEATARAAAEQDEGARREAAEAEQRRQAWAAEATRQEAEAKAAARAAKPVVAIQTRGESGAQSSQRTTWTGEITDLETLDLHALRPYIARAALDAAVRQYATTHKDTQPLAGARIFEKTSTSFR